MSLQVNPLFVQWFVLIIEVVWVLMAVIGIPVTAISLRDALRLLRSAIRRDTGGMRSHLTLSDVRGNPYLLRAQAGLDDVRLELSNMIIQCLFAVVGLAAVLAPNPARSTISFFFILFYIGFPMVAGLVFLNTILNRRSRLAQANWRPPARVAFSAQTKAAVQNRAAASRLVALRLRQIRRQRPRYLAPRHRRQEQEDQGPYLNQHREHHENEEQGQQSDNN